MVSSKQSSLFASQRFISAIYRIRIPLPLRLSCRFWVRVWLCDRLLGYLNIWQVAWLVEIFAQCEVFCSISVGTLACLNWSPSFVSSVIFLGKALIYTFLVLPCLASWAGVQALLCYFFPSSVKHIPLVTSSLTHRDTDMIKNTKRLGHLWAWN